MKLTKMLAPAALALLALSLAGCADLRAVETGVQTLADAQIPGNVAIVAANSFDGIEEVAANILTDCTPNAAAPLPASLCSSQKANLQTMIASIRAGRPIRNAIEPTSGQTLPASKSAYDKLQAIISTLTGAVNAFNAAKSAG